MHKVGIEVVGNGALKLTEFLREKMQQKNMNFKSPYTVSTLKEASCAPSLLICAPQWFVFWLYYVQLPCCVKASSSFFYP